MLALVMVHADVIQANPLPRPICTDSEDDKFLACAIAGGAKIVVSGDKALLRCSGYESLLVITPRRCVSEHLDE